MYKKGQIEMIGLVIVVILLVIGLLFYFKFGILRKEQPESDPTRELAYANNLIGALFNVEVCNGEYKIEEILIRCFEDKQGYSTSMFCDELGSCDYAEREIGNIIGELGLKSYKKYSISIRKDSDTVAIKEDCETGILSSTTLITPDEEHYTADFRIC